MRVFGRITASAIVLAAVFPPIYASLVRYMLRRNLRSLRAGEIGSTVRSYASDIRFVFPGESSWSADLRGRDSVEKWIGRFAETGFQLEPEEILVSGPPWKTLVCLRFRDDLRSPDGRVIYENRGTIFGRISWGKVKYYEVSEDTQKVAALDEYLASRSEKHE